jgi:hypothetical protein
MVVLVGAAALWITVPAAWAQKSAEKATEDRKGFRESVVAIRGQIDTTMAALDGIGKGKDAKARKSALKKYSDEVKEMGGQIEKTRDYAQKMKERGKAYFKEWEKSMKGVTNPDLKASGDASRAALQAQYEKIEKGIAEAKDDSAKFWQNVQDLEKFYTSDLSDNAISTSAKLVETTTDEAKKIQGYIDEVVKAVDEVGKVTEKAVEAAPGEAAPEGGKPTEPPPPGETAPTPPPA